MSRHRRKGRSPLGRFLAGLRASGAAGPHGKKRKATRSRDRREAIDRSRKEELDG